MWALDTRSFDTDTALAQAALPAPRAQVHFVLSQLGADAALIGAAEVVMEPLFGDPAGVLAAAWRTPFDGRSRPAPAALAS